MILFELIGNNENNPAYKKLEVSNGGRQYDFLTSIVQASLEVERPLISGAIIKALNFHAIACLHISAGEYRPCEVIVGTHSPPDKFRVPALMDDFVNIVNRLWDSMDPIALATYVLWRLNFIHPFINGNGRTARAVCYFVICVKSGGLLPGTLTLPELIKRERVKYVDALKLVDESAAQGNFNLAPLHELISELVAEQLASAPTA